MKQPSDYRAAWKWAQATRRNAIRQKQKVYAEPRNPLKARPGYEAEFKRADEIARNLDTLLTEADAARARAQIIKIKRKTYRLADRALDTLIVVGLCLLGALGVAAALIALHYPDAAVRTSAIVGVVYVLVRDPLRRRARK